MSVGDGGSSRSSANPEEGVRSLEYGEMRRS